MGNTNQQNCKQNSLTKVRIGRALHMLEITWYVLLIVISLPFAVITAILVAVLILPYNFLEEKIASVKGYLKECYNLSDKKTHHEMD